MRWCRNSNRVSPNTLLWHWLVVVMVPEADCQTFVTGRHGGLGDFVDIARHDARGAAALAWLGCPVPAVYCEAREGGLR